MLTAEDRRVSNARTLKPALGASLGVAPTKTAVKKPNLLARAYDAFLNTAGNPLSNPVNTGRGVSMGGQGNAAQVIVEPTRQAARRAVGDITAIPGVGARSASPTATDIKEGNYLGPVLDYATLATTAIPAVRGIRNRPVYGVHSSPIADLNVINPRVAGQAQRTAADAVAGSSYMWDARSPYVGTGDVLKNPQMNLGAGDFLDEATNTLYLTKAPRRTVMADANVPQSPSLRILGPQKVVGTLPIEREAMINALRSYGINPRSQYAQNLVERMRLASPRYKASAAQRLNDLAEERLRVAIRSSSGQQKPNASWGKLHGLGLDPNAPLEELLRNPTAADVFNNFVAMVGKR